MRKIYAIMAVLTLGAGLALAQSYPAQSQPSQTQQSQPDQSQPSQQPQEMPQTQQPPASQGQASADSQSLQSQIQKTFQEDPALSNVSVSVTDSNIVLSGTVATKADKDKARTQVESNAGTRKVIDNINVSGSQNIPPQ